MNPIQKAWIKLCDQLYSTPPERREDGRKVMNVDFEYNEETQIANFTIDRLCRLRFKEVTPKIYEDALHFQLPKINFMFPEEVAGFCLWFKNRGCDGLIGHYAADNPSWFEMRQSESYVTNLKQACTRLAAAQRIA